MGLTNFPNGINVGSAAGGTAIMAVGGTTINVPNFVGGSTVAPKFAAGSAVIAGGSANVATGLTSVLYAQVTPLGPLSSTAGTVGGFVIPTAQPIAGGTIIVRGYDQMGTVSSNPGTVFWQAIGS
jgi:hypothetical protein